jgi:hypothetical protein
LNIKNDKKDILFTFKVNQKAFGLFEISRCAVIGLELDRHKLVGPVVNDLLRIIGAVILGVIIYLEKVVRLSSEKSFTLHVHGDHVDH